MAPHLCETVLETNWASVSAKAFGWSIGISVRLSLISTNRESGNDAANFARRREIASRSFTMHPSELLLGEGDHVAALTEGRAILDGGTERSRRLHSWPRMPGAIPITSPSALRSALSPARPPEPAAM